mmetsp:Transcript_11809/g.11450  ORF Transcript_11809/g.11450 Transcript_11809/m.11450 type:complete len:264 (+) Transcript_11809:76-867(+)|eukprot:CAMPEP_0119041810 /NCGR_PEP_ID=MMETSP1177-20130426/13743_1 /TAXON_ID=2985 /ORGANISM="Ochromonas sp, Strain CCMP1899" /LENGTH=263 /DNA_ID=CAMNT_0007008143 /DNA_START=75 /DNA_END=866 /DNA_ORIENTATION=+
MSVAQSVEACASFKQEVLTGSLSVAQKKLDALKELLLDCDSLPPLGLNSPTAEIEQSIARETLEYAVVLSVKAGDKGSFQRYLSSLRPYYTGARSTEESEIMYSILGLNLLYLLVENRLADFHCELELLTKTQQEHPYVTFCTQLDQHLMVGSYDQVMAASAHPPVEYYNFFLKSLLETVRVNIGECAAASYSTLTVQAATKIFMFTTEKEVLTFVTSNYPDWCVVGNTIELKRSTTAKFDNINSLNLISQNLSYATELERIV